MKPMKPAVLREMSLDELKLKVNELKEILFRYRFQASLGQMESPVIMRIVKQDIARVKTVIRQKELKSQVTESIHYSA